MAPHRLPVCASVVLFAGILSAPSLFAQEIISVGGTGSAIGTMRMLGKAFEANNKDVKVHVAPSIGSSGAVRAVQGGALQIGVSSRPPAAGTRTEGVVFEEYARTPFVPVVNSGVAVKAVTTGEVERIYRGEMTTWPDGQRVRIVLRPPSDIDHTLVGSISPGIRAALEALSRRMGMLVGSTDQENADLLEKTPGAFGFSALSVIVSEHRSLTPLSLNGAAPTVAALVRKAYPYAKSLYFVTPERPAPGAIRFIAFIRSPEGRTILESGGNLPVDLQRGP